MARWERTPDRNTWCASTPGRILTVTKLANGKWQAVVNDARSPELNTRVLAERWAENRAGAQ
jgi:hypothetical protein